MSRPVLVARCENYSETSVPYGMRCTGELRFEYGAQQAACTTCGAWCGVAVAQWLRVEPLTGPSREELIEAFGKARVVNSDFVALEGGWTPPRDDEAEAMADVVLCVFRAHRSGRGSS